MFSRRSVSVVAFAAAFASVPAIQAKDKPAPQVIVVGMGAKNATFDESKFPNLTFVYTPNLVSTSDISATASAAMSAFGGGFTREEFRGDPDWMAKWSRKQRLVSHAVLFDKEGVGYWEGDIDDDDVFDSDGNGEADALSDCIDKVMKGKTTDFDNKKEFNVEDDEDKALLNMKMPEAEVTTLKGATVQLVSLMPKGKPVLVVFIQMNPKVDIALAKKNLNSDDSGKSWSAKSVWGAYENCANPLKAIERGFFKTKYQAE